MTQEWTVPAWAVLLAATVLVLAVAAVLLAAARLRAGVRREVAAARAATAALQERVDSLQRPAPAPAADAPGFVITRVGERDSAADGEAPAATPGARVDGPLFADLVLRETVVQVASLAHGVRRALGQRDRIRSEVRREVRRSRKQRRVDVKAALREYHARQRAAEGPPPGAGGDDREVAA